MSSKEINIRKIYPTHEELQRVTTFMVCSEEGCKSSFSSESNLNLHLIKTHKKPWDPDCNTKAREFYCPTVHCIYNSTKCFDTLKQLKQHYLKVHSAKSFICTKCSLGFPTASSQNRHEQYCGINFKCCECEASYPCYESLLTHSRRKKHEILEKHMYNLNMQSPERTDNNTDIKSYIMDSYMFSEMSTSSKIITVIPLMRSDSFEKSSQTENRKDMPQLKSKQTQVCKRRTRRNCTSKHSQTSDLLKKLLSTETQTVGDYVNRKIKLTDMEGFKDGHTKSDDNISLKSIKTQTQLVTSQTKSCNTTFKMDESEYNPFIQSSSSSTQTVISTSPTESPYSTSTSTHDSIHTDTSDLNLLFFNSDLDEDMIDFKSSDFLNCNMETQTDIMFDNDVFNDDCYSNMETQTIETSAEFDGDIFELLNSCTKSDDVPLNTTHTQTIYDFLCRSVESQTLMSHNKLQGGVSLKDNTNIETQTEIDLTLLLEGINA